MPPMPRPADQPTPQRQAIVEALESPRTLASLRRFSGKWVATDEESDDLVQRTALQALRVSHTYDFTAKPTTWLFSIMRFQASNIRQRTARREWGHRAQPDAERISLQEATVDAVICAPYLSAALDAAIADLPPSLRASLELYSSGVDRTAAAHQLKIGIQTYAGQIGKARRRIAARIRPYVDADDLHLIVPGKQGRKPSRV